MTPAVGSAHWVFDLDGTLADGLGATRLRPGAADLLARLAAEGTRVSLWSAGGSAYATRVALRLGIIGSFRAIEAKITGTDGRWLLPCGWTHHPEVVCVDDEPARLPPGVRVVAVRPWLGAPGDAVLAALAVRADQTMRSAPAQ